MRSGAAINTLDLAREYLTTKAIGATTGAADEVTAASRFVNALFAPETLARATVGGSATPFSIGNIALQTNLLDLIETHGGSEGAQFLNRLQSGSHIAQTDTILTNYMMQFIQTGKLDLPTPGAPRGGMSDAVSAARRSIEKSSAITPTTNIANVQHMSDAVFQYKMSDEGLKGIVTKADKSLVTRKGKPLYNYASSAEASIISYSEEHGGFVARWMSANGKQRIARLDQDSTKQFIRDQMSLARNAPAGSDVSGILDSGISYIEASRADRILANSRAVQHISSSVDPDAMIRGLGATFDRTGKMIARTGAQITSEDAFIDALAATREHLGYSYYHERPDILSRKGMTRFMAGANEIIGSEASTSYVKKLAAGGISAAFDDPMLRRSFVEMANITSSVPYMQGASDQATGFGAKLVRESLSRKGGAALTEAEIADRVSNFNSNVGQKLGNYLSELGVSFGQTQKSTLLYGANAQISRPIIASDILRNIEVEIEGRKMKFLGEEFLSDYSRNKFALSVVEQDEGEKLVNIVFGDITRQNQVISEDLAEQLSSGIVDELTKRTENIASAKHAFEEGIFSSENEAKEVIAKLRGGAEGVQQLRSELKTALMERGLGTGSISGREAQGTAALMAEKGSGIANDVVAFQNGMQFSMAEYGDDFVALEGRISEEVLATVERSNPALAATIRKTGVNSRNYKMLQEALMRSNEDASFGKRIIRSFGKKRLDNGILGTRLLGNRDLRDEAIRAAYSKHKGKVGLGVLAVGALSAGYYIAKKHREKDLYNETVKQQSYEPGRNVVESNDSISQSMNLNSTRRDPLVTAGVVGNLDRNKVGHTQMGPNKYSHLYG